MSDLQERLREKAWTGVEHIARITDEAADRIEELEDKVQYLRAQIKRDYAENERLRDVLRFLGSGRRYPTCPTCQHDREVARDALEKEVLE